MKGMQEELKRQILLQEQSILNNQLDLNQKQIKTTMQYSIRNLIPCASRFWKHVYQVTACEKVKFMA